MTEWLPGALQKRQGSTSCSVPDAPGGAGADGGASAANAGGRRPSEGESEVQVETLKMEVQVCCSITVLQHSLRVQWLDVCPLHPAFVLSEPSICLLEEALSACRDCRVCRAVQLAGQPQSLCLKHITAVTGLVCFRPSSG